MDLEGGVGRSVTRRLLESMWDGLGGAPERAAGVILHGAGSAPSPFAASDVAQAAVAVAGLALAELTAASRDAGSGEVGSATPGARRASGEPWPEVLVERGLASAWFVSSYRPIGWAPLPAWDAVAGDYASRDGWIRLHTNAPHHRAVALQVLGVPGDRAAVAAAVGEWRAEDLEREIHAAGGVAAAMRTTKEWEIHAQGASVGAEPLLHRAEMPLLGGSVAGPAVRFDPHRPLAGVRILDLTRVLAGPVATRFLAGYGAEVLRLDPPDWDEPPIVPDVTVGKRCARIDLKDPSGRDRLLELLASADVVVHGYRPGALDGLGLGEAARRECRPGIVDVSLDAYGWTGPWAGRRGFDSLVQMSAGIAETGMRAAGRDHPVPLPFQALDHATGYLLAAAVLRGITLARRGVATTWRASLARTAALLVEVGPGDQDGGGLTDTDAAASPDPRGETEQAETEQTVWSALRRLPSPLRVGGVGLAWRSPARPLGTDEASW